MLSKNQKHVKEPQNAGWMCFFFFKDDLSHVDLLNVAVGMARGVAHMHKNKCIHRDIACRNFLLSSELRVVIAGLI